MGELQPQGKNSEYRAGHPPLCGPSREKVLQTRWENMSEFIQKPNFGAGVENIVCPENPENLFAAIIVHVIGPLTPEQSQKQFLNGDVPLIYKPDVLE